MVQRKGGSSAKIADDITKETAKYVPNFRNPRSADAPTGYQVTVAASMYVPEYLQFAKTRMKSTIRNRVRTIARNVPGASALIRKAKTSQQIKEKAAVKAAGKAPGTATTDPAVDNILQNSDSVGHSWIKLSPIGDNGPIQTYSFGFIPENPGVPHGPQQAVPGYVRNPDLEFEAGGNNLYLDTPVDQKAYLKSLTKIAQLKANAPAYMTIGYNCTQFTKEIARIAGATFPSKAGMMIPISDRGFLKRAMSPNALYAKLDKDQGAQTTSPERDLLEDDSYTYSDDSGISQRQTATTQTRGLRLLDIMRDEDDPEATIEVERDEEVIPLGESNGLQKVDYEGRELYATDKDALLRHLEQQPPKSRSKHTLRDSLTATGTRTGKERTLNPGTLIMAGDTDMDQVEIETPMPDAFRGSCDLLSFWKAVGGIEA